MKATYIGRYQKGNDVELEYEYKGQRYWVHENRAKGNEPLSWQHKSEQANIDRLIALSKCNSTEPAEVGLNMFFESVGI